MCLNDQCPDFERRRLVVGGAAFIAGGILPTPAVGEARPSNRGNLVKFATGVGDTGGYLVLPSGCKAAPAVVVMHGEIGIPEGHRLVAQELADAGFCALVVETFSRNPGFSWEDVRKDAEGPRRLMSEGFFREREQEALGALAFLRGHPRARKDKMGAVGFCAGGILAVRLSLLTDALGATVSFYGPVALAPTYTNADPLVPLVEVASRVRIPLQIHYGTSDYVVKQPDVDRFAAEVRKTGTEIEVYSYERATHAFYDRTNAEAWNEDRGKLAHDRYIAFLRRHLG